MVEGKSELEAWKDAIWDYLLEHSDITKSGALFVKFHTDNRRTFEGHVRARIKGYHRGDPRQRERMKNDLKDRHEREKEEKRLKYLADREERRKMFAEVKWRNELRCMPWYKRIVHRIMRRFSDKIREERAGQ